jgi:hypothetical protein
MGPTFYPQTFVCSCPIRVIRSNGLPAWRFSTTQQVYGATKATISLVGVKGSKTVVTHHIRLNDDRRKCKVYAFREPKGRAPHRKVKIDDAQKFGVELELSSPPGIDSNMIANMMPRSAGDVFVAESHGEGKQYHSNGWKVVPDGSIVCNRNVSTCHKFELVSNILDGGKGLDQIYQVTRALGKARIQINKSMGFHVHVDVLGYSIEQLIKICQNFIKVC